jgi:lysophospholipase L1-like esterase
MELRWMSSPASDNPAEVRLLALGTSLTARGGWLQPLATALGWTWRRPVQAINMGGPGRTSAWGLARLADAARVRADIALIEFASNDADVRRAITPARSRANLAALIDGLRTADGTTRIFVMTMSPALGLRGLLRPALADYYRGYHEVAAARRAELIDIYAAWRRLSPAELHAAIPDGLHPTAAAHRRITLPTILAALERAPPSPRRGP